MHASIHGLGHDRSLDRDEPSTHTGVASGDVVTYGSKITHDTAHRDQLTNGVLRLFR